MFNFTRIGYRMYIFKWEPLLAPWFVARLCFAIAAMMSLHEFTLLLQNCGPRCNVLDVPIQRGRVVTEWFDEHENGGNHMPWPSYRRFWSDTETVFSTTINKTPNDGISRGRMVLHPSDKVPETSRIYVKVHWSLWLAQRPIKTLCWYFLYFGSYLYVPKACEPNSWPYHTCYTYIITPLQCRRNRTNCILLYLVE
jgi:hypothetical protein